MTKVVVQAVGITEVATASRTKDAPATDLTWLPAATAAAVSAARSCVQTVLSLNTAHRAADESAALACVTGTARTELQAGYARLPASGVTDVAALAPLVGVVRATADSAYLVVADGLRPSGGVRLLVRMSLNHGNWMIAELQDAGTP